MKRFQRTVWRLCAIVVPCRTNIHFTENSCTSSVMLSGQNEKIEVVLSCVIHLLCRQTEHMLIFLDAQAVRKIVWCNSLTLTPTRCPKGSGCVCADVCLACRIMASRGLLGDAEGWKVWESRKTDDLLLNEKSPAPA